MPPLDYQTAGVDIEAADEAKRRIRQLVEATHQIDHAVVPVRELEGHRGGQHLGHVLVAMLIARECSDMPRRERHVRGAGQSDQVGLSGAGRGIGCTSQTG